MKKVLILAYDFPPYTSVGGLRPYGWYKYMPEFDVYPIVVTRQWDNKYGNHLDYISSGSSPQIIVEKTSLGTIIKTPYFPNFANNLLIKFGNSRYILLRKLISAYYEFAQFFYTTGPKAQLYNAAKGYLSNNDVDCIITTGDPFILFNYAAQLSEKFNIPWIADYRDPWSSDISMRRNSLVEIWNAYLEKKIVRKANLVTTVSKFLEIQITNIVQDKKFLILPNGYDPEIIESIKEIEQQNQVLTIGFVGTIYKWYPLKSFLSVVSKFLANNKDSTLKLNFYGINLETELNEMITSELPNLKQIVSISPRRDNLSTLKDLATANIMLLFNYYSHMGTKIYDYIGINRTILFCYQDDQDARKLKAKYFNVKKEEGISEQQQEELINETNSGIVVKDAKHLYDLLGDLCHEFSENGCIKCNTQNAGSFSRKYQTGQLVEAINNPDIAQFSLK